MIQIFDTTLRDGSQMSGVNFSAREKISIAKKLDEIGFHYIEGGWPGANPKDSEFFQLAKKEKFQNAKVCAFGSTHHKNNTPENDPILQGLLDSETPGIVLFGKSSRFQAEEILQVAAERNLEMIEGSIRFFVERGKEVIFDAEHFFDGFIEDSEYALECLRAAERGGAINVTLADTNGGMLPEQITQAIVRVQQEIKTPLGIHTHNDSDLAVANSLAAVDAGITLIQGTINGLGERCGNANLCSIIPSLQLKKKYEILSQKNLGKLTELSRFVQELGNLHQRYDLPFVGKYAFRHKGGVHASAIRKNPKSYEHIDPFLVGNESSFSVSEQSGRANISDFLEKRNISYTSDTIKNLLDEIKRAEGEGLSYEDSEASLEVLSRKILEKKSIPFEISNFYVRNEKKSILENPEIAVEATVQTKIFPLDKGATQGGCNEEYFHTAGLGNGPVNALDVALRKALEPKFPFLKTIELVDFKVRILDVDLGTSAKIRVQVESEGRSGETWRTVGCSQNIIAASVDALLDSYIFAIWREEEC